MPAAKLTNNGVTVKRPRANIPLHPELFKRAKAAAANSGKPLSVWLSDLMAEKLKWKAA
jgi:hypothetical protein